LTRFALATLAAVLLATTSSLAQSPLGVPSSESSGSVSVLSESDARLYRDIFADERTGHFADANSDFARVNDTSLRGYVLAERYLSPRARRVPVKELVAWLDEYHDLPIADGVYRLAVKRSTKRVRRHHHTILVAVVTNIPAPGPAIRHRGGGYEDSDLAEPPLVSQAARSALPGVEQLIRGDQPDQANASVQAAAAQGALSVDIARLDHRVAASYLAEGMDQRAYDVANSANELDKRSVPLLYWDMGLAAYRQGRFDDAARAFETLASIGSIPNWTRSGAAFWAARAHMQTGDANLVIPLLQTAAKSEPTFYGLIAERILGQDTETGFSDPSVNPSDFAQLMQNTAAHRAVALYQIGNREDAADELNRAFGESDSRFDATFAAIAHKVDAPNLELRASETCASRGIMLTGLFPVPDYRPEGGYHIDPSLVLAFARIESRFQPEVTSPAGAKGLMQLMPGTAAKLAGSGAPSRLYDASYNLALGQRYIEQLLNQLNGNLFQLAAAYNAGPGALTRWSGTKSNTLDDPLLFIESIPVSETRAYVKRMMTYHWMYRRRMGRDAKSLDETAGGEWPIYHPSTTSTSPIPSTVTPAPAIPTTNAVVSDASPSS
jgi:soluble lytic murein transglycosylase-like protein